MEMIRNSPPPPPPQDEKITLGRGEIIKMGFPTGLASREPRKN